MSADTTEEEINQRANEKAKKRKAARDKMLADKTKEKGLLKSKRPFTHEFYLTIMDNLKIEFQRIEITHMSEDTFYAVVIFRANGAEHRIDSRPSDAIALALNRKIPIMANERLFRRELTQEEIEEYEGLVKKVNF